MLYTAVIRVASHFIAVTVLLALALVPSAVAGPAPLPPANAVTLTTAHGGKLTIDPDSFRVYDLPADRFETMTGINRKWQSPEQPLAKSQKTAAATGRVLTILVEWEDHYANPVAHSPLAYDSMLYSDDIYPTGSVKDYYQEVSYNAFQVSGDVVGWVSLSSMYDGWYDINEIVAAAGPLVNFADYDGDGDGYVDALWLIHAGPGQEETHDLNDIWSHAYGGVYVPTGDGVALNGWSMQPEEYANGDIVSIRVFAHEYGHILGMPDLYDYDDKLYVPSYYTPNDNNDHPLVDWDVMGYAGYAIMSYGTAQCPSYFSAWSRNFLGWGTPEVPSCLDGAYTLYNIAEFTTQNIFKIPITDDGTEYFLLEYRNPHAAVMFDHLNSDFSAYFPWFTPGQDTLDAGLLITHIDENVSPNNGTPGQPHYAVAVVDAGYDPGHPWDGVSEFSEWWSPYEFRIGALYSPDDPGQTTLSPTTTPSSDGYGGPSGITITVTQQTHDYLTVEIHRPSAPVIDPQSPVVMVEGESQNLTITATDLNCSTPSLSASSLPSYAALVDQGDGTGLLSINPALGDAGAAIAVIVAADGTLADTLEIPITVGPGCLCEFQGDLDGNGFVDSVDLSAVIDVVFFGAGDATDPQCPITRSDFNNDGVADSIDLSLIIDYVFFGGSPPANPC